MLFLQSDNDMPPSRAGERGRAGIAGGINVPSLLSVTTEEKPVSLALARLLELPGYLHHRTLPITSRVRKRLCDTLNKEAHSSLLLALATMSGYVVKVNN